MRTSLRSVIRLFVVLAGVLSGCADQAKDNAAPQARVSEQQQLVDKARLTVVALRSPGGIGDSVNQALDGAWGALIFPNLLRAGFIVGVAGGNGVLLGHTNGGWSDLAFYFTGEGSFGLQIGAEAGHMTDDASAQMSAAHQQHELPAEFGQGPRKRCAAFPANVSGDVQMSAMGVFR